MGTGADTPISVARSRDTCLRESPHMSGVDGIPTIPIVPDEDASTRPSIRRSVTGVISLGRGTTAHWTRGLFGSVGRRRRSRAPCRTIGAACAGRSPRVPTRRTGRPVRDRHGGQPCTVQSSSDRSRQPPDRELVLTPSSRSPDPQGRAKGQQPRQCRRSNTPSSGNRNGERCHPPGVR